MKVGDLVVSRPAYFAHDPYAVGVVLGMEGRDITVMWNNNEGMGRLFGILLEVVSESR